MSDADQFASPEAVTPALAHAPQDDAAEIMANIRPQRRRWPWALVALTLSGLVALIANAMMKPPEPVRYLTAPVERGDITLRATSTGNLEPRRKVTIGAQLSGLIDSVHVQENERVTTGQVLARIDTRQVDNELATARATLSGAQSNIQRSQATLSEAEITQRRVTQLVEQGASPVSALDLAHANLARARADLAGSRAEVARARASVKSIETQRSNAEILSPIDGVVLLRAAEPGNTVAASFTAPELFILAEDLSQMELQVLINEADVSLVQAGQRATFLVDAWPERTFEATVQSVSFAPTMNDNVVTYLTRLSVQNDDALLRPGMTAATTIETGKREGVLTIPAEALWFQPDERGSRSGFQLGPKRRSRRESQGSAVYVLRDGKPKRIALKLGRTDGERVEVRDGELREGDEVILGVKEPESDESGDEVRDADVAAEASR